MTGDPYDHRGDAEKTAIVEEDAAEGRQLRAEEEAELAAEAAETAPGPVFPAGPAPSSVDHDIQLGIQRRAHPLIFDMPEQTLRQQLLDGACDPLERGAVHLLLAVPYLLDRPFLRGGYLREGRPGEVRVEWRILHQHLPTLPLPADQQAALRIACSLAGEGMPVDLAGSLRMLDAGLRLAASAAVRRACLWSAGVDLS